MADILLDNQASPATPAAGRTNLFVHSGTKIVMSKDDSGKIQVLPVLRNWNTAAITLNAADTYITGSGLTIPVGLLTQVGTTFRWRFAITKTAAGVATPIWNLRVGTGGVVGDTARCTGTLAAQTGVAEGGMVDLIGVVRVAGASGILAMVVRSSPHTAAGGIGPGSVVNVSSAFDMTVANLIFGVSANPGASGVWTCEAVSAECDL